MKEPNTLPKKASRRRAHESAATAERRAFILAAAHCVFIERGYEGASTEAIVARTGGSKETIYAYFGNKLGLFDAVCREQVMHLFAWTEMPQPASLEQALRNVGTAIVTQIARGDIIKLARILVAEFERLKPLLTGLVDSAQQTSRFAVARMIAPFVTNGAGAPYDTLALAEVFLDLLLGRTLLNALLFPRFDTSRDGLEQHVEFCISVALRLAR